VRRRGRRLAAWCASVLAASAVCAQPAAREPSGAELEFWRSAQSIGTVEAYRAYRAAYPEGTFVPLADAALAKLLASGRAVASSVAAPGGPAAATPPDAAALRRVAGPTGSTAITFQVGDAFRGPGPITVGWLGAKKQVLLPEGPWILLAARDSLSSHLTRVPVTQMMLAQFEGPALRALLLATFNSRTAQAGTAWAEATACEARATATKGFADAADGATLPGGPSLPSELLVLGRTRACFAVDVVTPRPSPTHWQGELGASARDVLDRLGVRVEPYAYLRTDLFFTGDLGNFLKVVRVDIGEGLRTRDARRQAARAYAGSAALGYTKSLDADDLEPVSAR
jgi:hypothetical protein